MKIQELRIGNKVLYNGIECEIDSIGSWNIDVAGQDFHYSSPIEQLMPVPITEKHLIELEFQKEYCDDDSYYWNKQLHNDKLCDLSLISGDKNGFLEVCIFPYSEFFRFKYLHQIQNLLCDLEQE